MSILSTAPLMRGCVFSDKKKRKVYRRIERETVAEIVAGEWFVELERVRYDRSAKGAKVLKGEENSLPFCTLIVCNELRHVERAVNVYDEDAKAIAFIDDTDLMSATAKFISSSDKRLAEERRTYRLVSCESLELNDKGKVGVAKFLIATLMPKVEIKREEDVYAKLGNISGSGSFCGRTEISMVSNCDVPFSAGDEVYVKLK